jgi:ribonuclease HI
MNFENLKLFTDGGARGNPGPAACAYIAQDSSGKVISSLGKYLGQQTNNFAEYQGVLLALDWLIPYLQDNQISQVTFNLDSLLVVNQINLIYRIKEPTLIDLHQQVILKLKSIKAPYKFLHIPRSLNSLADALVNQTLDLPHLS